ncbi:MAG: hypothetical protein Q7S23_06075 [bacterium]|nr:hypothetical protein [bacterium]
MLDQRKENILLQWLLPYVGIFVFNSILITFALFFDAESWGVIVLVFAGLVFLFSVFSTVVNIFRHKEWDGFTTGVTIFSGALMLVGFISVIFFFLFSAVAGVSSIF